MLLLHGLASELHPKMKTSDTCTRNFLHPKAYFHASINHVVNALIRQRYELQSFKSTAVLQSFKSTARQTEFDRERQPRNRILRHNNLRWPRKRMPDDSQEKNSKKSSPHLTSPKSKVTSHARATTRGLLRWTYIYSGTVGGRGGGKILILQNMLLVGIWWCSWYTVQMQINPDCWQGRWRPNVKERKRWARVRKLMTVGELLLLILGKEQDIS
jgi:hypothetical protein